MIQGWEAIIDGPMAAIVQDAEAAGVQQFFGVGVHNGVPFTFFHDNFGKTDKDFDDYIARLYQQAYEQRPEDEEAEEQRWALLLDVDEQLERPLWGHNHRVSLKDIADDGTPVFYEDTDYDEDDDG